MSPQKNSIKRKGRKVKGDQGRQILPSHLPANFTPSSRLTYVTMGYAGSYTMTESGAGTGAIYQFRLNSLYDPDYTGTGTYAQGYSAYNGLYQLMRVVRVRAIASFYSGTSGNMTVGWLPSQSSVVAANFAYLEAQPFAKSVVLQGNTGGGHSVARFDQHFDLARVTQQTRAQYMSDQDYAAAPSSNPTKSVYLTCFLAGHAGSAQSVGFTMRLVYEVEVSIPYPAIVN